MTLSKQDIQKTDQPGLEAVARGNTEFALALYQALRSEPGNLFFSPYSISTALAMTYAGARGNTAAEMAQTLHFLLAQEALHPAFRSLEAQINKLGLNGQIQLKVANSLWPQQGYTLLEAFLALTKQYYGVGITAVDYGDAESARSVINAWVEQKTEDKIKDLIPPGMLRASTCLVLVNAIYFKGAWASQFDPKLTQEAPFWVAPARHVKAPMMTQEQQFKYGECDGLQILELPYQGNDLSMLVVLPKAVDGLADLEKRLTSQALGEWVMKLRRRKVRVFLPKFEITMPFELSGTLKAMGMVDAFGNADFSGMDGRQSFFIGAVLHKAFAAVNEEGTVAAAATAVIATRGLPMPPPVFRADHPFILIIRENSTGSILFLGRVANPVP